MIYYLNKGKIPTIPTPYDFVIKKVDIKQNLLMFIFEDNISTYDSNKYIQPKANFLWNRRIRDIYIMVDRKRRAKEQNDKLAV